ncbi:MAG TPA: transglutaminase-like domain-containing protein [Polyangiaceae bacterium]|jgi:regulator of sirC expression with transglutaminase-like and TPR domain|nr:transglutaminase-like domain-containing protein [Polyangiaceae bacterium]
MTSLRPLSETFAECPPHPLRPARPATFEQLARLPDEILDVATGAALIARDAYARLDIDRLCARFDQLAAPLVALGLASMPAMEQVRVVSSYLYEQLGFRGNEQDYYDPRNSLLPDVLDRRLGIPITLALVYCEVATRAGVRARGVSFPGHFLVRVDAAGGDDAPVAVDPFFGGRVLEETDLQKLLERASPAQTFSPAEHLAPATSRAMLVRMLINLKWIYATRGDFARALLALDRIVCLTPDSVPALRERGLIAVRLGAVEAARADLSRLLELVPQAPDASTIRKQLEELHAKAAVLN